MRVLVTGAAGFIGSHLCERLLAAGDEVTGVDSFDPYYGGEFKRFTAKQLINKGLAFIQADLTEPGYESLAHDAEVVFHLAAQPGNSAGITFETYLRNNVVATQQLLEACAVAHGLRMFVNVATSSIYGAHATGPETTAPEPVSHYGVTKLAAEQLVLAKARDAGFPACSLRLFSVYGERERPDKLYPKLLRALADGTEVPLYEGAEAHIRSYTYVGDIVDGLLLAADRPAAAQAQVFNLGTDEAITTGEGIRLVEELWGARVRVRRLPPRPGEQAATAAHIAKARSLLGYAPRTTPREGLARMVDWYRREIHGRVVYR